MKAILEFNLPEEREEFELAQKGLAYKHQLDEVWDKVFRPRHKHGYGNKILDKFMNTERGQSIMNELESIYQDILKEEI